MRGTWNNAIGCHQDTNANPSWKILCGVGNAFLTLLKEGVAKALYFCMPAFFTQTSANAAIRFLGFSQCNATLILGDSNPTVVNLVAAIGAGSFEASVWASPTECLKVLRQLAHSKHQCGHLQLSA